MKLKDPQNIYQNNISTQQTSEEKEDEEDEEDDAL